MPWVKGQSGNPAGGQKGARRKLAESFLEAMQEDWKEHGKAAIAKVRAEDTSTYLRVVASVLPKEIEVEVGQGLAALLSGIGREDGTGDVIPLEDTGSGAICH